MDGPELASQFDNTSPTPDPVWEPIQEPSEQWEAAYLRGVLDKLVPGKARMYSDVMMQTANDLANMPQFQAKVRTIESDEENGGLKLGEYMIASLVFCHASLH